MNKKILAKKIFNFKKNKKITEEVTQLDEILGMGDLKSDEGLGNLQSTLSTASAIASVIPQLRVPSLIAGGLSWAVNKTRRELDANGVVPSRSGNLDTQGNMILTGLGAIGSKTQLGSRVIRQLPFVGGPISGIVSGLPGTSGVLGAGSMLASTEYVQNAADPISNALGLPNIPGVSKRLTKKEPLSTRRTLDVARSADTLSLIAAANARR